MDVLNWLSKNPVLGVICLFLITSTIVSVIKALRGE